jgi:thiol-disulfide isomerase/thioredoxin
MSAAKRSRPTSRRTGPTNRFWVIVIGVIVAAGLVAVGMASRDSQSGAGTEIAERVRVEGGALPPFSAAGADPAVGRAAPALAGRSPTDTPTRITPGGGEPALVVFLAHWCPHCRAEVPRLVALSEQGVFEGVQVAAVTTGTARGRENYPPSAWLERERWTHPVLADTNGGTAAKAYGLTGYPFLVFIDADGKVAARTSGELPAADVTAAIERLKRGEPLTTPGGGPASPAGG